MANVFKASEVVEIAIGIEQNGYMFYSAIAAKVKEKMAMGVFEFLAGEEKKHKNIFRNMLQKIGKDDVPELLKEDYELYIRSVANSHIFAGPNFPKKIATASKTTNDAINAGVAFEKDSIIFFQEMLNYVPESQHKTVRALIDEEKKHLIKLTELKESLVK